MPEHNARQDTSEDNAADSYAGVPRERIAWYPTIDAARCQPDQCELNCIAACLKNVYARDASGRMVVAHPLACTVGDISCSYQCPCEAISFPSKRALRAILQRARDDS